MRGHDPRPRERASLLPLLATLLVGSVIGAATLGASERPEARQAPATPVEVVGPLPVPVDGDVRASLDEPVEVVNTTDGALQVEIRGLEARLDALSGAVGSVQAAVEGIPASPPPLTESTSVVSASFEDMLQDDLHRQEIHHIAVASNNDTWLLLLIDDLAVTGTWGSYWQPPPDHFVLNLPAPVIADEYRLICMNESRPCKAQLQLLGRSLPSSSSPPHRAIGG